MDYKPATLGQFKQIIDMVIKAIPANSFSFDEAERLLRDGQLAHDINVMLRRHTHNEPVKVCVPESAADVFVDLNCRFNTPDETSKRMLVDLGLSRRSDSAPTEVLLEVISFESGTTCQEILHQLEAMGYRSADFIEASGFLQARGKMFRNPGRSTGPHGFRVILPTTAFIEFTRYGEDSNSSVWHLSAVSPDASFINCFGSCFVLAAKL